MYSMYAHTKSDFYFILPWKEIYVYGNKYLSWKLRRIDNIIKNNKSMPNTIILW